MIATQVIRAPDPIEALTHAAKQQLLINYRNGTDARYNQAVTIIKVADLTGIPRQRLHELVGKTQQPTKTELKLIRDALLQCGVDCDDEALSASQLDRPDDVEDQAEADQVDLPSAMNGSANNTLPGLGLEHGPALPNEMTATSLLDRFANGELTMSQFYQQLAGNRGHSTSNAMAAAMGIDLGQASKLWQPQPYHPGYWVVRRAAEYFELDVLLLLKAHARQRRLGRQMQASLSERFECLRLDRLGMLHLAQLSGLSYKQLEKALKGDANGDAISSLEQAVSQMEADVRIVRSRQIPSAMEVAREYLAAKRQASRNPGGDTSAGNRSGDEVLSAISSLAPEDRINIMTDISCLMQPDYASQADQVLQLLREGYSWHPGLHVTEKLRTALDDIGLSSSEAVELLVEHGLDERRANNFVQGHGEFSWAALSIIARAVGLDAPTCSEYSAWQLVNKGVISTDRFYQLQCADLEIHDAEVFAAWLGIEPKVARRIWYEPYHPGFVTIRLIADKLGLDAVALLEVHIAQRESRLLGST